VVKPLPRSRVALLLALLALATVPSLASAQSPNDVVGLVCDVAGGTPAPRLPVCPSDAPGAPAAAGRETEQAADDHQHEDAVSDAQDVATEAQETAQDVADNPTNPGPVLDLLTLIVQFILDQVLGPIGQGIQAAGQGLAAGFTASFDGIATAGTTVGDGVARAYDGAASAVAAVGEAASAAVESARAFVESLFTSEAAVEVSDDGIQVPGKGGKDVGGLVNLPDVQVPKVPVRA